MVDVQLQARAAERARLLLVHTVEALVSVASNILTIGVFFFMEHRFGWTLLQNFMLSAGLGAFYIVGALAAHGISERFGRRNLLIGAYAIIIVITLSAAVFTSPIVCTIVILAYAMTSATTWPVIENLVSAGESDPHALSHRLAVYNMVWSAVGAIVVAANGIVIEKFPVGVFLIPSIVVFVAAIIVFIEKIEPSISISNLKSQIANSNDPHPNPLPDYRAREQGQTHSEPEPQLARQRVVALWLSRISVPAMYLMIYALAAMLPSLPVLQSLSTAMQTLVCSVWLAVRWAAFVMLGFTTFWHTRPRLLLGAAFVLFVSFLVITLPNSIGLMIAGQIVFGAATGLIYSASLYFGMVLSEGSTEHGGYHEALIGVGMTLGPAVGAGTQWIFPKSQGASITAIAGLIGISVIVASVASLKLKR